MQKVSAVSLRPAARPASNPAHHQRPSPSPGGADKASVSAPRSAAAIATPKGGDRKWNVAARTAPIRCTSWNQMNVAAIPGTRMV